MYVRCEINTVKGTACYFEIDKFEGEVIKQYDQDRPIHSGFDIEYEYESGDSSVFSDISRDSISTTEDDEIRILELEAELEEERVKREAVFGLLQSIYAKVETSSEIGRMILRFDETMTSVYGKPFGYRSGESNP